MVAVVTVMGTSITPYNVLYIYVHTSGLYLFNCGRGQKGEYIPEKRVFQSIVFGALHI